MNPSITVADLTGLSAIYSYFKCVKP